jgi:three-Cys-motif partner protein
MKTLKYDEIGYWSEVKLDIIKDYVAAYTTVMAGQKKARFQYIYIDAFAGAGQHVSKRTGEFVPGSPVNALNIPQPFLEYHFIDINNLKVAGLEAASREHKNVFIYNGDCNKIILDDVFPRTRYEDYKRAICNLDPYGLHLDWGIIKKAGEMKSVEIFLNFPIMDINRNVLKHDKDKVDNEQVSRMNRFWGDESWRQCGYAESQQGNMFGETENEKVTNEQFEQAFRKRLKEVAGFKFVPEPMPMRNSNNTVVYYLYFATQNVTGEKIIKDIFKKYLQRREV